MGILARRISSRYRCLSDRTGVARTDIHPRGRKKTRAVTRLGDNIAVKHLSRSARRRAVSEASRSEPQSNPPDGNTRKPDAHSEERQSRERLRELAAHLEAAREEERRTIAAALHDDVGQLLTSIRLELSGAVDAYRHTATKPHLEVTDRLQAAAGLVDLAVDVIRRLSSDLRPPILDQVGLIAAVRWEAALFEKRTGIRCRVSMRRREIDLPADKATALYRIFREALTNVARHAKAGAVSVTVRASNGVVLLRVRDNGVGIRDQDVHNPAALGILGMRERALAIGGQVRISHGRGRGTDVQVTLPVGKDIAARQRPRRDHGRRLREARGGRP